MPIITRKIRPTKGANMIFTPQFTPLSTFLFYAGRAPPEISLDEYRRRFSSGISGPALPAGRKHRARKYIKPSGEKRLSVGNVAISSGPFLFRYWERRPRGARFKDYPCIHLPPMRKKPPGGVHDIQVYISFRQIEAPGKVTGRSAAGPWP